MLFRREFEIKTIEEHPNMIGFKSDKNFGKGLFSIPENKYKISLSLISSGSYIN